MEAYRVILRNIEEKTKKPVTSGESDFSGKLLETAPVNFSFSVRGTKNNLTSLFKRILPRTTDPASGRVSHS